MKRRVLSLCLITLVALTTMAQWKPNPYDTPAYNAAAPAKGKKMNPILSGMRLSGAGSDHPAIKASYKAAAENADILYQLPCYCYCDRSAGHNSLRSCFESEHGAHCDVCMKEALLAQQMTKQGKTVKQIRAAIMNGDFQKIDLNKIK
ncbi:MAG: hypothetical protein HYX26_08820 [Acidobacteriales bacterium]|nr:hypothetical protein [Terriglobales bacterium]